MKVTGPSVLPHGAKQDAERAHQDSPGLRVYLHEPSKGPSFLRAGQSFPAVPCSPSLESCLAGCGSASSLTPASPLVEKLQSSW